MKPFNCNSCKIKTNKQKKADRTLPIYNVKGSMAGKYWTKARLKTSWANSKLCISMSDVKVLFRSPTPFSFVDCNTLLSLGLVPLPIISFPQLISHGSGISNTLESPRQSKVHFYSFIQWPLSRTPFRNTYDTHLSPAVVLSSGGRFHNPFLLHLIQEPEPHAPNYKVILIPGLEHGILIQLYLYQISSLGSFLDCLSLVVLELDLWIRLALNLDIS